MDDSPVTEFKTDPDDVHLYTSPWVSGTRASAYFGPLSTRTDVGDGEELDTVFNRIFDEAQRMAATLGANSIVGVELIIDPYAVPPYVSLTGTAAHLVPLFA